MSLIADALKKAQAAKLGRRYLSANPGGVPPVPGENLPGAGSSRFETFLDQLPSSRTFWVGLGSGIVLFVILLTYFFLSVGRDDLKRAKKSAASSAQELLLTPPPAAPALGPVPVERFGDALASGLDGGSEKASPPGQERGGGSEVADAGTVARATLAGSAGGMPSKMSEPSGEHSSSAGSAEVSVKSSLSEEVRRSFNLAHFYQKEGNFQKARAEYEKVIRMWPLYAEARNNLGVVYKELGMYEEAIEQLKKALALNSRYTAAYHNLGVVYQLKENWIEARRHYERVLALNPNHLGSYNNLGLVYRAEGRIWDSRTTLERALAIDPAYPQTHYNMALVLEEAGEVGEARLHFERFVRLSGTENAALVKRVQAYLNSPRFQR